MNNIQLTQSSSLCGTTVPLPRQKIRKKIQACHHQRASKPASKSRVWVKKKEDSFFRTGLILHVVSFYWYLYLLVLFEQYREFQMNQLVVVRCMKIWACFFIVSDFSRIGAFIWWCYWNCHEFRGQSSARAMWVSPWGMEVESCVL